MEFDDDARLDTSQIDDARGPGAVVISGAAVFSGDCPAASAPEPSSVAAA